MSNADVAATIAKTLADLSEMILPVREATLGYRAALINEGMAADAADRCAADFHHWLMALLAGKKSD
jgi:hypothetical protein